MAKPKYKMIFKDRLPPEKGGYPGFNPRTVKDEGMIIEYDVPVKMRDGVKIYADIFRPDVNAYRPDPNSKYPVIIAWGPYGKHGRIINGAMTNCGLDDRHFSKYSIYEGPDPVYWCQNSYIILNPDPRGLWGSEGEATFFSPQETEDCYDLIEWAGTQKWSTGKVGMLGVSYLAWTQWKVAALHPPHLTALCPWEGVSDFYRELALHGGIPETWFYPILQANLSFSPSHVEDLMEMRKQHPLFDDYWASKNADLAQINIPALIVASWTDHGLHNRGTFEGYKKLASKDKWLVVHGRKKWAHFYQPENVEKQRQFFNYFLKGIQNRVSDWPKVTLEVREKYFVGKTRTENEFPIARTQYTPLYLNAANGLMRKSQYKDEVQTRYTVDDILDKTQNAKFEF